MRIENANASDVLERILSAYGFTMQKELAERLEIAKSNVAGWLQRGQIPGNVIVQCALDTGSDINWIVTGELAKTNFEVITSIGQGKALYDEIMSNGGKPVLRRILDAYGFKLQKQLCDLLHISSGTVSTWIRREYFPGDVVVACALDTGVSLKWLATGKGNARVEPYGRTLSDFIPKKYLIAGNIENAGEWFSDLTFLPRKALSPIFLLGSISSWLVDTAVLSISNGRWLLSINDKFDIYDVMLLPGNKISVSSNGNSFICSSSEVVSAGKVLLTMDCNY